MYVAINRLEADQFVQLAFTLNFGISAETKKIFVEALQNGGGYEQVCNKVFVHVDDQFELLKLHKYFDWVDKKLHSHNFMDNKDQITDDLLADFKDPSSMAVRPGILSQQTTTVSKTTV